MFSSALTYDDFYRTGIQDCGNVLSIDEFDFKAGTPEQIVDKAWAEWEDDGMEETWLEQQDDLEGLDPHKCYESWRSGWKSCARRSIAYHLERLADEAEYEENPPARWWRKPAPTLDRPCYRTKTEALRRFLDVNYQIVENYGGADYKVSPSEFDSINHKYDLTGKKACRTIAEAVWAAMPVGKPYCLDRIDLDALNDTSPARESGISFQLPDSIHEAAMMAEEARHYAQDLPEPAWVTEHEAVRVFPALPQIPEGPMRLRLEQRHSSGQRGVETYQMLPPLPPLPEVEPYRVELEEQEPGVSTFRFNPSNPVIYGAGVLAGAYRGKDISRRTILSHAVSDVPISIGRLKRDDGEAFCNRALDLTDPYGWRGADTIDCPKCLEILARIPRGSYTRATGGYRDPNEPAPPARLPDVRPYRVELDAQDGTVATFSVKDNPAWVTNILSKHFVQLEEQVPPQWLPKLTKPSAARGKFTAAMKEYGCGAYGCVLPTLDPKVVLKLTTDDTEAQFAFELADKLTVPVVVKYHLTRALPDKYKGRQSFLLWRDSADYVGQVEQAIAEEGGTDPRIVEEAIAGQHKAAQDAFDALHQGLPATKLLQKWEDKTREMGLMAPELRELAEGMITNLHKDKVFFGDVHGGNIGRVNGRWVVVDPGHVAVLEA